MRTGRSINDLAAEITRQADAKRDYVAPCRSLSVEIAESREPERFGTFLPQLALKDYGALPMTRHFEGQLATSLKISRDYWDRMRDQAPALLAQNANHWLSVDDRRRMVRTLDGHARAYLSDGYRPLDNVDLAEAVLPPILELGLEVKSAEITERRLYLQVVSPRVEGEVKKGDVVQAGFVISNSEIGSGSFRIEELLYRLACLNGMVRGDILKKYHAGGKAGGLLDEVQAFYRDSTRKLDDAAFFAKVTDTVRHVVSRERFEATLALMRGAAEVQVKPIEAIEVVSKRLALNEGDKRSILDHLIQGGDFSVWGVANAVTRLAHSIEDYDRSVELEKAGNDVIELKRSDWQTLDALAA